ncbi:MAG: 4Fe-4S dicluster domain-containing protein [candidate division KSB1 bacterium]|nr:4Fe-4S dicluster domain-containing protein [candidate division KSB1 bacterium]MDZ7364903.1 4Fe-4S dicluster domain-containing protein [candidate division KSB1 bacterium]MDZ7403005.1 4Fe-4S dicluster domain-containing protein [candidate division KSB1 bacterium]
MALKDPKYDKPIQLRKTRRPKQLAVIDQSGCTGCQVCIDFCPADCILVVPGSDPEAPTVNRLVEVDLTRCIGCTLCAKYCPWLTIEMLDFDEAYRKAEEWTIRSVLGEIVEPVPAEAGAPRRRVAAHAAAE